MFSPLPPNAKKLHKAKTPIIRDGKLFEGYIETNEGNLTQYFSHNKRLVFEGFYNNDVPVAIVRTLLVSSQQQEKEQQQKKEIEREFRILKELRRHENFIRYYAHERDENFVYFATEVCLCSVADLLDPALGKDIPMKTDILKIPEKEILRQATSGLNYLHNNQFVHRNIKPNNFLIKEINKAGGSSYRFVVKITDFRLSRKYNPENDSTLSGPAASEGWEAPESTDTTKKLSTKLDVFILGCFYHYVLTAWTSHEKPRHPFGTVEERATNIRNPSYSLYTDGRLSLPKKIKEKEKVEKLITWMLKFDEDKRPTLQNVFDDAYFKPSEDYMIYADQDADQDLKPGLCVIVNQQEFEDPKQNRKGSDKDKEALKNTFKKLGFDFKVYENLDSVGLESEINELANKKNFENYGCLVVCLLSHGIENAILCYDSKFVNITKLKYEFSSNNCPSLYGKPKIFIVQSCQSNPEPRKRKTVVRRSLSTSVSGTLQSPPPRVQLVNSAYAKLQQMKIQDSAQRIPPLMDFITIKSTLPGLNAKRSRTKGSKFIQALCKVLSNEYLEEETGTSPRHLEELLRCVQNEIDKNSKNSWQTMQWEACLSKNIRFRNSCTEGIDLTSLNFEKDTCSRVAIAT
ncbi:uncharacterized protein LOC130691221 [Daphnia carinata]|uniref:uncharacterized protein LOC130691221 n=1 Tax=Daphnia carinata TaxID=120202 RepID=UPI00257A1E0C|nr:uncharacterized protein LOC130691221 [Daphnia carinata]